jgi:hypothetical protein
MFLDRGVLYLVYNTTSTIINKAAVDSAQIKAVDLTHCCPERK